MGKPEAEEPTGILCNLGPLLEQRNMTLVELSEQIGISVVNLSV